MDFLIVTGMSGSGKTYAMHFLEDIGYYCIDNMPTQLILKFAEICARTAKKIDKVAVAIDIRSGDLINSISADLEELKNNGFCLKVLYLEASDDVLLKRYKETRRKHPLDEECNGSLPLAIRIERERMTVLKLNADYCIDTSLLSNNDFRERLSSLLLEDVDDSMIVDILSFGFKFGIPTDADLVFDVRCLPNPFYIPELKLLTGRDKPVCDYVLGFEQSVILREKLLSLVDFLLPLYVGEGKSRIVIAFGCTGGKHRSVTFAEMFFDYYKQMGYKVRKNHRDIEK